MVTQAVDVYRTVCRAVPSMQPPAGCHGPPTLRGVQVPRPQPRGHVAGPRQRAGRTRRLAEGWGPGSTGARAPAGQEEWVSGL